jgi:hypothetical protein
MNTDLNQRHDDLATVVLAAIVGLTGIGALLDAALTATGHPVLVGLGGAVLALLVGFGRWVARRVRERREDAADLLAGAAWRAEHMPHLAAQIERDRAGVA